MLLPIFQDVQDFPRQIRAANLKPPSFLSPNRCCGRPRASLVKLAGCCTAVLSRWNLGWCLCRVCHRKHHRKHGKTIRGFRCIQGSFHYIQGSMNSASSGPWTLNASLLSKDWDVWASSSLGSHGHTSTKRMPGLGSPIRFILSPSLRIKVERPKILFGVAAKKPKNSQNNKKGRVRIPKTCRQLTWWFGPNRHVRNDRWGFRARLKVSQIIILGVNSLS